jgi:HAD superfamily hydrolase (TIGR01509 family)
MMIQALIFDCDGTLIDSMYAHFAAWRDALSSQGMQLCEQSFYRHSGTASSRVIPMLAAEQGIVVEFESALAEKEERFLRQIELLQPIEPIVQIAREHRGKLKMAVASGGTRALVHQQLKQLNIYDWFDAIVTCEDTANHKPDPDVFLEAADRLGVRPEHCCVYEDGEPGIEAARRAGMDVVDVRKLVKTARDG